MLGKCSRLRCNCNPNGLFYLCSLLGHYGPWKIESILQFLHYYLHDHSGIDQLRYLFSIMKFLIMILRPANQLHLWLIFFKYSKKHKQMLFRIRPANHGTRFFHSEWTGMMTVMKKQKQYECILIATAEYCSKTHSSQRVSRYRPKKQKVSIVSATVKLRSLMSNKDMHSGPGDGKLIQCWN